MQDALLHALVEGGDGFAILRLSGGHVALGERLARTLVRLARLTAVRVTVSRARFSDDTWFAIVYP